METVYVHNGYGNVVLEIEMSYLYVEGTLPEFVCRRYDIAVVDEAEETHLHFI